jgi:hypothetical protein
MAATFIHRPDMDSFPSRSAAALPPLLDALRRIALQRLPALSKAVLEQADDALFDFAQRSGSSLEQQPYFDAMRELRRERAAIEQTFIGRLTSGFGPVADTSAAVDADDSLAPLSLVDAELLEEQLACEQIVTASDKRHRELLHRIGTRLQQADHALQIPDIGPRWAVQISGAFRAALASLAMPIKARLVLLKLFERAFMPHYGDMLQAFDRHLQAVGLEAQRPRVATLRPRRAAEPEVPPRQYWPATEAAVEPAPERSYEQPRRYEAPPEQAAPSRFVRYHGGEAEDEVFATLRELLALRRAVEAAPSRSTVTELPRQAALDALTLLQNDTPASILAVLDNPNIALADILGSELIAQARGLGLASGHAALQEQDAQALSLVGMLFDVLLAQRSYHRDVRRQFLRLSVPYARAALLDPRLFALKSHPARRLLDALAEASDGNRGETAPERDLMARVDGVVDRLVAEFNENIAIFSELEAEFRGFLDQHRLRIQLAEQRASEAHSGRERLDAARSRAAGELAALVGRRPLPKDAVGSFLRDSWTHHLTMIALRDGADSERFHAAQRVGAAVWGLRLGSGGDTETLRPQLLEVLASSGLNGELAEANVDALCACVAESRDNRDAGTLEPVVLGPTPPVVAPLASVSANEHVNDVRGPAPQAPGEQLITDAVDALAATIASEATSSQDGAAEADAAGSDGFAERIRALAIGDWVEFVEADGTAVPAKLSWISPISGRLLFVNRRGMRHCAAAVDELAALLAEDKLLLRGHDSAFSRAMIQVLGQLRQPVGGEARAS